MDGKARYNPQIHHRRSIRLRGYDYSNPGLYFITICTNNREHRFGHIAARVGVNNVVESNASNLVGDESIASGAGASPAPTMVLNEFGEIAHEEWLDLQNRFPNIELGEFIIMPNHMHGIISITDIVPDDEKRAITIGNIVGAYKSLVAKKCLELHVQRFVGAGFTPALNNPDNSNASIRAGVNPDTINNAGIGTGVNLDTINDTSIGSGVNPAPTMGKIWQRNFYEHIIRNEESYNKIADYIISNPANWRTDKFYG